MEIEKRALLNEKDAESKERLKKLDKELAEIQEKSGGIELHWKNEKEVIGNIRLSRKKIDELKQEAEISERRGDLQKVAEIRYGKIPSFEKSIKENEKKLTEIQKNRKFLKEEVKEEDIAAVVSRWTGIPVTKMLEDEAVKLVRMEDEISRRVIGQREAITSVANAIRRSRAGISEENRPIGSFIFLGPTGVGKTELARALAEFMFNDESALVRVDMSEYMERHTVSKLVGSPPGYVGYEEGGQLTEIIRRRPYSVILFDEIEKAHPDVFNVLLQILDDGRLTDAKGRVVNFKNAVIIMTSNIGSSMILELGKQAKLGFQDGNAEDTEKRVKDSIMGELKEHFKPEFLNRVDEIIVFHSLSRDDIAKIVGLQLARVEKRLEEKKIAISVSTKAKDHLAEKGFDPSFGARPLKRIIQQQLLDPLALNIVSGKVKPNQKIKIDLKKGELVFA